MNLKNIMVLDIETAPEVSQFSELSPAKQQAWIEGYHDRFKRDDETPEESFLNSAGLHAEFSKVICVSLGQFEESSEGNYNLRLKSVFSENENELLLKLKGILDSRQLSKHFICAHNGKFFDIPFLCKRYTVNKIGIPIFIDTRGRKPWEMGHILDTKEMWSFGVTTGGGASLATLCAIFEIPTPKDDIKGKDVGRVFWEGGLNRIETYCKKDVLATARVLTKVLQLDIQIEPLEV